MSIQSEIQSSSINYRKYQLNYIAAILNIVEHEKNGVDKMFHKLKEEGRVCDNEK